MFSFFLRRQDYHIHAFVSKKRVHRFIHKLEEGNLYKISNFSVIPAGPKHKPVIRPEWVIKFTKFTVIQVVCELSTFIPRRKFDFIGFKYFENNRRDQDEYLTGMAIKI